MTAHATVDIDFDPFAPRPFGELPPVWAELRDRAPVYRTAAGMYVVSQYDDVRSIQRSPALERSPYMFLHGVKSIPLTA
jgi:cytochrome P450